MYCKITQLLRFTGILGIILMGGSLSGIGVVHAKNYCGCCTKTLESQLSPADFIIRTFCSIGPGRGRACQEYCASAKKERQVSCGWVEGETHLEAVKNCANKTKEAYNNFQIHFP